MEIKTVFACGDKAFVLAGNWGSKILEYTVGQVRVEVTASKGHEDSMFDNYKPQSGYKEEIMCEETGVRSGSIYTVGKTCFPTMEDALVGQAKVQAEHAEEIERERLYKEKRRLEDIAHYKNQLAALERANG